MNKVREVLFSLQSKRRGSSAFRPGSSSSLSHPTGPLGWFLCPDCLSLHLISSTTPDHCTLPSLLQEIKGKVETISRRQKEKVPRERGDINGYVLRGGSLWKELQLEQHKRDLQGMLQYLQEELQLQDCHKKEVEVSRFVREGSRASDGSLQVEMMNQVISQLEELTRAMR